MKYCFCTDAVKLIPKYSESNLDLIDLLCEINSQFDLDEEFDSRIKEAITTHKKLTEAITERSFLGWVDLEQTEKIMS